MTFIELISAFIGSALSGLGLFALYKAWRNKNSHALYIWGGWGFILSALIVWAIAGGKDRGVALGMIVIIFQALVFIGYQAAQEGPKAPDNLVKLGLSLKALGHASEACAAFGEVTYRFSKASPRILGIAQRELKADACKQ